MASSSALLGRSATLVVSNQTPIVDNSSGFSQDFLQRHPVFDLNQPVNNGIDLSQLRFTFDIKNGDFESPNNATIRVYNLKKDTLRKIIHEFDTVTLQAGYQNNIGIIFSGTIKQFVAGRENNIDSFLEIRAADGDINYNFGLFGVNGQGVTLKAGHTREQVLDQVANGMGLPLDGTAKQTITATGGVNVAQVRGKTLFGLTRTQASNLASTANARFSINNGVITYIPLTGYLPSQAVQVNSLTGMVGVPETTDNGIQVTVLLNPLIKIGTQIQINQQDITQTIIRERVGFPAFGTIAPFIADATESGFYRVLVAEHSGDTRGQEWYTKITALSLDPTATPKNSVLAYG